MEATIVHDDSPKNSTRTIAICIDGSDFAQHALVWAVKNLKQGQQAADFCRGGLTQAGTSYNDFYYSAHGYSNDLSEARQ